MAACSVCSGLGTRPTQRSIFSSQGPQMALVYDPCQKCGGTGMLSSKKIRDKDTSVHFNFLENISACLSALAAMVVCMSLGHNAYYANLTLSWKIGAQFAAFCGTAFIVSVFLAAPTVRRVIGWVCGLFIAGLFLNLLRFF